MSVEKFEVKSVIDTRGQATTVFEVGGLSINVKRYNGYEIAVEWQLHGTKSMDSFLPEMETLYAQAEAEGLQRYRPCLVNIVGVNERGAEAEFDDPPTNNEIHIYFGDLGSIAVMQLSGDLPSFTYVINPATGDTISRVEFEERPRQMRSAWRFMHRWMPLGAGIRQHDLKTAVLSAKRPNITSFS